MPDDTKTDADAAVAAAEKVDADVANETTPSAPTLVSITGTVNLNFSDGSTQPVTITGSPAS